MRVTTSSAFRHLFLVLTSLFIVFSFTTDARASGEQCVTGDTGNSVTWFDPHPPYGYGIGSQEYNRQISGTTLRNSGGNWWLMEETARPTLNQVEATLIVDIHSTSSIPSFDIIFNTYGAGTYIFFTNNGMNSTQGCPGTNDTSQPSGYAYFSIDSFGAVTYEDIFLEDIQITQPNYINQPTQYNTRFTAVQLISATSTIEVSPSYFIDPTEATTTRADKNPTLVRIRYSKVPETTLSAVSYEIEDAISPVWGYGTTTIPLNLATSSTYDLNIQFANQGTGISGIIPFPQAYIYLTIEIDEFGQIVASTTQFYSALEQTLIEIKPCGFTEIQGCIENAFNYLFIPSQQSIEQFSDLKTEMEQRAPIVYFLETPELFNALLESNATQTVSVTASTTIGTFSFISKDQLEAIPFSDYIRQVLSALLYVMMVLHIYARVKNMFAHNDAVTV